MNYKKIGPFEATHPGDLLREAIKEKGMTQKQLSALTGIGSTKLSETVNGKRPVTKSMAKAFEKALDIPAEVWTNLQAQYDLYKQDSLF